MADTADKSKEPTEPLNLRIPKSLKKRFRIWCIEHEVEMTAVLIDAIERMVGKPPAKRHTPRPPAGRGA